MLWRSLTRGRTIRVSRILTGTLSPSRMVIEQEYQEAGAGGPLS